VAGGQAGARAEGGRIMVGRIMGKKWRVARVQSRGREVKRWKDEVPEIMNAKRLKCRRGVFATAGSGRWSLVSRRFFMAESWRK